jgi:hypothetical protein
MFVKLSAAISLLLPGIVTLCVCSRVMQGAGPRFGICGPGACSPRPTTVTARGRAACDARAASDQATCCAAAACLPEAAPNDGSPVPTFSCACQSGCQCSGCRTIEVVAIHPRAQAMLLLIGAGVLGFVPLDVASQPAALTAVGASISQCQRHAQLCVWLN